MEKNEEKEYNGEGKELKIPFDEKNILSLEKKENELQNNKKEYIEKELNNYSLENEERLLQKIESILFLSASYLSVEDIVRITSINPIMVKELIEKLIKEYANRKSSIIINKREVNDKIFFKMDIKPEFHYLVNKIVTGNSEFTKAEQETLAIIAYKQPIKQSSVVRIRSNKAYAHIKHFIEAGLVKAKKLGRTLELTLSEDFYNYFDLKKESQK